MMAGPGRYVADLGKAADVGIPEHGVQAVRGAALHGAVVHAMARVMAEIGLQQARGDVEAGMSLHRQRKSGKGRAQQLQLLVVEAARPIRGEGIDDARAVRGVPVLAEGVDRADVVGRAGGVKFDQRREIVVFRPQFQAAAQPRIGLARPRPHYDGIERALQPNLRLAASARVLLVMDGIQVAPPSVAVAAPLRVQGLGRDIGPHQRYACDHETLAIAVEQIAGRRATQP